MSTRPIFYVAALALLLGGCVDDTFTSDPTDPSDKDEDGYSVNKGDCDDSDPEINPGAKERVNCIDDNCNDKIDEGTDNEDKDGDGYCPSTGDIKDCEGDRQRHPGMAEDGGDGSKNPNGIDDDCNGIVDDKLPSSDVDGDGFSVGDGDCNDDDPFINPGAIEVEGMHCRKGEECPSGKCYDGYCRCISSLDCSSRKTCTKNEECPFAGETCQGGKCVSTNTCNEAQKDLPSPDLKVCRDNTDNDCDKKIDEIPGTCDELAKLKQDDPHDYAKAIELCDIDHTCGVDSPCPGKLKCVNNRCTRLLSATFDSQSDKRARAISNEFALKGPFHPRMGESFVILSTGLAVYDPAQVCPQSGTTFGNTATDPDPKALDKTANDYVHLALEILVPSNAQTFEFDFHFFSTEYPEWVGSAYNDTFWVQLQSTKFTGNISFDKNGTPIRINNAFFSICDPSPAKPQTLTMCTKPSSLLQGTGYDSDCVTGMPAGEATGGSTDWLHTISPVEPGEVIKLTFSIFDKGDHILDSAVLIDNFRWKLTPASKPSTGPD